MSTITPTGDQRQVIDVTTFQVGDTVRCVSGPDNGKIGTIITPRGLLPTLVLLPIPHYELLPQAGAVPVPLATPAPPITLNVDMSWNDGSFSTVPLSTLRRV